uniref:Glutaredoxin-like protein n=1 Tax=Stegastes partitus TaxID=144197 RepID=A0A3B4Z7L8_9TELE
GVWCCGTTITTTKTIQSLLERLLLCSDLKTYTFHPCPLCDEAKEVLQPFKHRQVDISLPENKLWWDKYKWDIPVFHLNGQFAMKHRVDMVLLDKLLQEEDL